MLYTSAAFLGALTGLLAQKSTALMIRRREADKTERKATAGFYKTLAWMLLCAALWLLAALAGGISVASVRLALAGTLCLSLSAVDLRVRKIPNELLLSLLALQTGCLILGGSSSDVLTSLGGLAAGLIIFLLPAFAGKAAGLGDVKFAGVTGYILGLQGLLTAVVLMAMLILGYAVVLRATKKGGLKTKLALGPSMTAGVVAVMVYTLASNTSYLDLTTLLK